MLKITWSSQTFANAYVVGRQLLGCLNSSLKLRGLKMWITLVKNNLLNAWWLVNFNLLLHYKSKQS